MFTGIIQGQGNLISSKNNLSEAVIETELDLSDCKIGSSISCDGICLSIISLFFRNWIIIYVYVCFYYDNIIIEYKGIYVYVNLTQV